MLCHNIDYSTDLVVFSLFPVISFLRCCQYGISECYIEITHIHPKAQGGYEKWIWWIWLKAQGGYEKSAPVDMAKARGGYENTLKVDMVDMGKSSGWI